MSRGIPQNVTLGGAAGEVLLRETFFIFNQFCPVINYIFAWFSKTVFFFIVCKDFVTLRRREKKSSGFNVT